MFQPKEQQVLRHWDEPVQKQWSSVLMGAQLERRPWVFLTPLLAPSLVPVASPRLLSQEAWVSLGAARLTFGADRRGARRPLRALVLARAGGSASAEEPRKWGRERRARTSVPGALVGRGGAAASNRCCSLCLGDRPAPLSSKPQLQTHPLREAHPAASGSCASLACYLLCSPIRARPGSKEFTKPLSQLISIVQGRRADASVMPILQLLSQRDPPRPDCLPPQVHGKPQGILPT
ncbi:uncharacterized protein [Eschrichtius robustus]|uniref:uncharacterized protein n=1 Tax=Eschrichtius robustus TaxID=9764 RepID=UPI0035BEC95D